VTSCAWRPARRCAVVTETASLPGGGIFGLPGGPTLDLHCYEFLGLRDRAIRCRAFGLISPRPDELEAILTRSLDQIRHAQQVKREMRMKVNENLRITGRKLGNP
jgi:hypothetical protein